MHEPLVRDVVGEGIPKSIQNLICCLVTTGALKGQMLQPFFLLSAKLDILKKSVPWNADDDDFLELR